MPDVMPSSRWSASRVKMISTLPISTRQQLRYLHQRSAPTKIDSLNRGQQHSTQQLQADRGAKAVSGHTKPMLDAERSAALRDRLAAELSQIYSTEEAAKWAHRVLAAKNTLTAAD